MATIALDAVTSITATLTAEANRGAPAAVAMTGTTTLTATAGRQAMPTAVLASTSQLIAQPAPIAGAAVLSSGTELIADIRRVLMAAVFMDSSTVATSWVQVEAAALLRTTSTLTAKAQPTGFAMAHMVSETAMFLDMRGGVDTPAVVVGTAAMLESVTQLIADPLGFNTPLGVMSRPIAIRDAPGTNYPVLPGTLDFSALSRGIWFAFRATADATITFTWAGPEPVFIQGYEAQDMATSGSEELSFIDVDTTELALGVSAGLYYHVAVLPQGPMGEGAGKFWTPTVVEWLGGTAGSEGQEWLEGASLSWWSGSRGEMMGDLIVSPPIIYGPLPGALLSEVFNASIDGRVTFVIDGSMIAYLNADSSGQILAAMLTLPALAPGTHTLLVIDELSGRTRSHLFSTTEVEKPLDPWPTFRRPQVPGAAPGVMRWVFLDSRPGGEVYFLPTNPETMSSPHKARVITSEHSSAVAGQVLLFEGSPGAVEWTFEGWCRTRGEQEALERFQTRQRRLWIVDHLRRAWLCSFESLEWTEVRGSLGDVRKYRAKVLIYDGPVMVA